MVSADYRGLAQLAKVLRAVGRDAVISTAPRSLSVDGRAATALEDTVTRPLSRFDGRRGSTVAKNTFAKVLSLHAGTGPAALRGMSVLTKQDLLDAAAVAMVAADGAKAADQAGRLDPATVVALGAAGFARHLAPLGLRRPRGHLRGTVRRHRRSSHEPARRRPGAATVGHAQARFAAFLPEEGQRQVWPTVRTRGSVPARAAHRWPPPCRSETAGCCPGGGSAQRIDFADWVLLTSRDPDVGLRMSPVPTRGGCCRELLGCNGVAWHPGAIPLWPTRFSCRRGLPVPFHRVLRGDAELDGRGATACRRTWPAGCCSPRRRLRGQTRAAGVDGLGERRTRRPLGRRHAGRGARRSWTPSSCCAPMRSDAPTAAAAICCPWPEITATRSSAWSRS